VLMANTFAVGLVVGVGIKWLSPYVLPVCGALFRPLTRVDVKPLAKAGIKLAWTGLERGRELVTYLGETVEDALAEAREEIVHAEQARVEKA
jgi:hypothetical protein